MATPIIQSIQPFTITVSTATTGNTAAISAVNTSMSVIFPNGCRVFGGLGNTYQNANWRLVLSSSILVSAIRSTGSPTTAVVAGTVIEFANFVNSIQTGSISVSTATTGGTAAINAVSTRAFVIYQGASIESPSSPSAATVGVTLNSSVEVGTAVSPSSFPITVSFAVVDLTSDLVESVQQINTELATTSTVDVITINAVDVGRTLIIDGGLASTGGVAASQPSPSVAAYYGRLAGPTSVEFVRASSVGTNARRHMAAVVQFKAQSFATTVERGVLVTTTASTISATLATGVTTLGFVNNAYQKVKIGALNPGNATFTVTLDPSSVTATRAAGANGTSLCSISYEVVQWSTGITLAGIKPDWKTHAIETGVFRGLHPIDHGVQPYNIVERSI